MWQVTVGVGVMDLFFTITAKGDLLNPYRDLISNLKNCSFILKIYACKLGPKVVLLLSRFFPQLLAMLLFVYKLLG